MIQAAVLGGVFIGVLSALPIVNVGNCCCLWIISGGLLAAYLDQQYDDQPITVGRGVYVGAVAGIVGALIWLFASVALNAIMAPLQQRLVEEMLRRGNDMPPDARAWLEQVGERAASPFSYVIGFILMLFGSAFSAAGGAIGATLFRRGDTPLAPPPLPPNA